MTLSPYMGRDSIEPFLRDGTKGAYLLGLTSNTGAADLQLQESGEGKVFEIVCRMAAETDGAGLVVGLTQAEPGLFDHIPDVPLLMPGLGAQGGDLTGLRGVERRSPIVINVSRGILYSDPERGYAEKARGYAGQIADALGTA